MQDQLPTHSAAPSALNVKNFSQCMPTVPARMAAPDVDDPLSADVNGDRGAEFAADEARVRDRAVDLRRARRGLRPVGAAEGELTRR
jgi:hypothetical protein